MNSGTIVGYTTHLSKNDTLRKGDYIYEFIPESQNRFDNIGLVISVKDNKIGLLSFGEWDTKSIDLANDDLTNYQKLQLSEKTRTILGLSN